MNAKELADEWATNLKPCERHANHAETMYWIEQYRMFGDKAATMLRQQAQEIENLEVALKNALLFIRKAQEQVPLYTHPVKELTDEEILPIYAEYSAYYDDQRLFVDIYGFAKAILRKAQEKRYAELHTAKREWIGLTDADKQEAFDETQEASGGFWEFADYLEAKLKEKNT